MNNKYSMKYQDKYLNCNYKKLPTKLDKVLMSITSVILLSGIIVKSLQVVFS